MIRPTLILVLLLMIAGGAEAVQTELFRYARMEDYQDSSFRELVLADDGSWRLGLYWEEMLADELAFFSELADDGETLLLAGGGSPGKLILYDKNRGRHRVVHSAEELLFSCVEVVGSGDWVVGSGPGGDLYRVDGDGATTLYLETGEEFIWDLQLDGDRLWIATGGEGKLLRHDLNEGATEHVATLPDQNVFSLALDDRGRLLAGSSGEGLLYRVGDAGELELLADFDAEEVQKILPLPGGDLMLALARTDEDCETNCAAIYRLDADGRVEKQLSSDSAFIGDMLPAAAGGVWVASGNPAELDRLTAPYRGEIHGIEADRFYSDLHWDGEALWLLQSKPARLLRLSGKAKEGLLSSEVLDLGNRCRGGALRLESDLPSGCRLEVEARSGHGTEPGPGWSDWLACKADQDGLVHRMTLPTARYFQWRIRFIGKGDRSPRLHRVTASFLPLNRSPLLGNLSLLRPEDGPFEQSLDLGGRPFTQVLERGVRVQYQQKNGPQLATDPDPAPLRGLRQIQWDWLDPDGDRLRARLEFLREGETEWRLMEKDWEQNFYTWDSRGLPDGAYRLRVTADDGLDNSRGLERSSELLSERLLLDSSPPRLDLDLRRADGRLALRGEILDEGGGIVAALQWRRGESAWQSLAAADGLMDRVRVKLDLDLGPAEGPSLVELRARDEFGNWGYLRRELDRE